MTDTGIGIHEDMLDNLFEPFTQADEGFRRSYQGAGLGLSIVKNIVKMMNGSISVSSELGIGTEFCFCLTFKSHIEKQSEIGIHSLKIKNEENFCSILIAEDEIINRFALKRMLQRYGYNVVAVANGRDVLNEVSRNDFDLIFMDIQMPIMDGIEATKSIRCGKAGKNNISIPIVALTAFAAPEDKDAFLNVGMNGYLTKPVEVGEIISTIANVLKG